MLKATFNNSRFHIYISVDKFKMLWDDSYGDGEGYDISRHARLLGVNLKCIDLDSFVADMILSSVDDGGDECEDVNNEFFENCDAENCHIENVDSSGVIAIVGDLVELEV